MKSHNRVDGSRDEPRDVSARICVVVRRFVRVVKKRRQRISSQGDVGTVALERAFGRAMADEEEGNVRATDVDADLDQLLDRTCSVATEVDAHVSHDETALSTDGNATTTSLMGTHHAIRRHVGRVPRARCPTEGS